MLDLKFIRENTDAVRAALQKRKATVDLEALLALDAERRQVMAHMEELQHQQNAANEDIVARKKSGEDVSGVITRMREISSQVGELKKRVAELEERVMAVVHVIPNLPQEDVPVGPPDACRVVRTWGEPRAFSWKPRTHIELAELHGAVDFTRAAKISGSNFLLFKGIGARLERALINFMLDVHTKEHGYTEVFPPFLVNRASMVGTGQLPKFEEDMYALRDDELFLIPTAEVPVTNMYRDEMLPESALPVYHAAYSGCFRREAGSYGKDTKGMQRVHQFDKVELVKFVRPETSADEHEKLVNNAEVILQRLGLPYRVVLLSSQDLGFSASKCYDLEAWSPGAEAWLEVSSCSNFEAFQARRAGIRYRPSDKGSKPQFVHTLNGSGLALARTVICLLETHQEQDGSVVIPQALRPYLDGMERLRPIEG